MSYGTRPFHFQHKSAVSGTFAARLRAWRRGENLSQSEAALRLKTSKRTLQEWEQGRAVPHSLARGAVENVIRLMRGLGRSG
jgi:DNA-binding transcriptional regulator YiaG